MLLIANPYVGVIYQLSDAYISNVSCTCMSFSLSVVWYRPGGRCQLKSPLLPFFFPAKKKIYVYQSMGVWVEQAHKQWNGKQNLMT